MLTDEQKRAIVKSLAEELWDVELTQKTIDKIKASPKKPQCPFVEYFGFEVSCIYHNGIDCVDVKGSPKNNNAWCHTLLAILEMSQSYALI